MQLFVHAAHMQPHNIPRSPLAAASWSAPPYLARSCRAVGLATFCPNLENLKFINIACAHFRKLLTAFRTRSQLFWASVSASVGGMWRLPTVTEVTAWWIAFCAIDVSYAFESGSFDTFFLNLCHFYWNIETKNLN